MAALASDRSAEGRRLEAARTSVDATITSGGRRTNPCASVQPKSTTDEPVTYRSNSADDGSAVVIRVFGRLDIDS